jgi:hypothetical protein
MESVLPFARKNFLTGRAELVDKDELFADQPSREATVDRTVGSTFRIGAYTLGYTRDIGVFKSTETGIGVNFTAYTTPDAIKPYYGEHPTGWNVFLRPLQAIALRHCPNVLKLSAGTGCREVWNFDTVRIHREKLCR